MRICRFSIFCFLPHSRQLMKSGFTEARIDTFGSGFSSVPTDVVEIPLNAWCTFWIRLGRSFTATLLLLT